MYESYWQLAESPFRALLDDRWFHDSPLHEEALSRLFFLVEQQRRFGLLAGPPGTGKSLLLHVLDRQVRRTQRQAIFLDLTGLTEQELLRQLAESLNLSPWGDDSRSGLWRRIQDHLTGLRLARLHLVLMFDHLDHSSEECRQALERLLHSECGLAGWITTLVTARNGTGRLIQGELSELIDLRIELAAFDFRQTEQYVRDLLQKAGCERDVFTPDALQSLFEHTHGIPRRINRLCDLVLLAGMSEQRTTIEPDVVDSAAAELQTETANSSGDEERAPSLSTSRW